MLFNILITSNTYKNMLCSKYVICRAKPASQAASQAASQPAGQLAGQPCRQAASQPASQPASQALTLAVPARAPLLARQGVLACEAVFPRPVVQGLVCGDWCEVVTRRSLLRTLAVIGASW